jgi:hypothetical protein
MYNLLDNVVNFYISTGNLTKKLAYSNLPAHQGDLKQSSQLLLT